MAFVLACELEEVGSQPTLTDEATVATATHEHASAVPAQEDAFPTPASVLQIPSTANQLDTGVATPVALTTDSIHLSGEGDAEETITLSDGLWIVEFSIRGNQECVDEICTDAYFDVKVDAVYPMASSGIATAMLIYATAAEWSGKLTFREWPRWEESFIVGNVLGLEPGTQRVRIKASGDWSISFIKALEPPSPADPDAPIFLSGSGNAVELIYLSEGSWNISLSTTARKDCLEAKEEFLCYVQNFFVFIGTWAGHFGTGTGIVGSNSSLDWSIDRPIKVGIEKPGLEAGTQVVTVEAEADWVISFTRP